MTNSENGADLGQGQADMALRLRGKLQWVPVGAVVVLVAWVMAIPPVASGAYGAVGGTLMVIAGLLLAFFAATFAGYLLRPLRLAAGPDGLTVRLPLWPARTVPWPTVTGVTGAGTVGGGRAGAHVVVDFAPGADVLPRFCRPRSMYRRLAPSLGRGSGRRGSASRLRSSTWTRRNWWRSSGSTPPAGSPSAIRPVRGTGSRGRGLCRTRDIRDQLHHVGAVRL